MGKQKVVPEIKMIVLVLTEEELKGLTKVIDNDTRYLMDGWQHLKTSNPELWEKKAKALDSLKIKVFEKWDQVEKGIFK